MLTITQCRKYLDNQELSDGEITQIRDFLQGVAELAIATFDRNKCYNDNATQEKGNAISFNRIQKGVAELSV